MWQQSLEKAIDKAISMKLLIMLISTWLFYIQKLNQDGWVTVVLSVTGMRLANELSGMYKDIRTAQVAKKGK